MDEALAPPAVVADLAESCAIAVEQTVGVRPDFTPETLPLVDHYVQRMPEDASEEVVSLVVPMCGAYFGEVVRRHFGAARWHAPDEDYERWRVEFGDVFLCFNPIGLALETVLAREVEGSSAHFHMLDGDREAVRDALEHLGEVPEEEYYRFSTRFEVLDEAYAVLTSLGLTQGRLARHFGPEVYAAASGEPDPKQRPS